MSSIASRGLQRRYLHSRRGVLQIRVIRVALLLEFCRERRHGEVAGAGHLHEAIACHDGLQRRPLLVRKRTVARDVPHPGARRCDGPEAGRAATAVERDSPTGRGRLLRPGIRRQDARRHGKNHAIQRRQTKVSLYCCCLLFSVSSLFCVCCSLLRAIELHKKLDELEIRKRTSYSPIPAASLPVTKPQPSPLSLPPHTLTQTTPTNQTPGTKDDVSDSDTSTDVTGGSLDLTADSQNPVPDMGIRPKTFD